jgi:hypothetical protein
MHPRANAEPAAHCTSLDENILLSLILHQPHKLSTTTL